MTHEASLNDERTERNSINTPTISGQLTELKGTLKRQWARLTDDDLAAWDGRRDELVGKLQQRYGEGKAAFEDAVDDLLARFWTEDTEPNLPRSLNELRGMAKRTWGRLTNDDLMTWKGRRDQLLAALERRYERGKETFEDAVDDLLARF